MTEKEVIYASNELKKQLDKYLEDLHVFIVVISVCISELREKNEQLVKQIKNVEIKEKELEISKLKGLQESIEEFSGKTRQKLSILFNEEVLEKNKQIFQILWDKTGNIIEDLKSKKSNITNDSTDISYSESTNSNEENFKSFYDNDNYKNKKSENKSESQKSYFGTSISSIPQKNTTSDDILINKSSLDKMNHNMNDINLNSFCERHQGHKILYQCKGYCIEYLCDECEKENEHVHNFTHDKCIYIKEVINSSPIENCKEKNFLDCIEKLLYIIIYICNTLLDAGHIPDLKNKDDINFELLSIQQEFLSLLFKEYTELKNNIALYKKSTEKINLNLLKRIKNLSLSKHIILQSATVDLNIFSTIKDYSKFFITVFPHKFLNNEKNKLMNVISPILKKKYNTSNIFAEERAFIVINENFQSKNHKKIYNKKISEIKNILGILEDKYNSKVYLKEFCKINENKLEIRYDEVSFDENENSIIGGEKYTPPKGYFGIGLKISNDLNWPIAYLTFNKNYNPEEMRIIFNEIIEKKNLNNLVCKDVNNELDKRHHKNIGTGIYIFPNIENADKYTNIFDLNGKKFKILLMLKVKQDKIKEPENNKMGYWIVDKEFVKIYRILFKEIK